MSYEKMREAFSLPLVVGDKQVIFDLYGDFLLGVNEDINPHAIVRAVNYHDEMYEAIEIQILFLENMHEQPTNKTISQSIALREILINILTKARGGK